MGQEQVPQAALAGRRLELVEQRWIAGAARRGLLGERLLVGVHVIVHEGDDIGQHFAGARRELVRHRVQRAITTGDGVGPSAGGTVEVCTNEAPPPSSRRWS